MGSPSHPAGKYVYSVVLDPLTRRILLARRREASQVYWTVPKVPIRAGATCRHTAARFLRRRLGLPAVRIAPVVGRLFAIDDVEKRGCVVMALPLVGAWPRRPAQMLGPEARWWTVREARSGDAPVEPMELLDLVDGYWEGWLPDGEVSLARR
ncbi:hypothetical protein ACF08N_11765 [Streptomyces sp. NPDC015127]|uniref:hypothetical protein n=1 Tax=Streptomyces sp. NPDC015127 TaxID=3364939 RepID=UPI0036F88882